MASRARLVLVGSVTLLVAGAGSLLGLAQPETPVRQPRVRPPVTAVPQAPSAAPEPGTSTATPPGSGALSMGTTPGQALRYAWEIEGVAQSQDTPGVVASPLRDWMEVVEYREGDGRTRLRPGIHHGGTFVLTGPLPMPPVMFQWYLATRREELNRRSGSVIVQDAQGREIQRFNVYEAWPRSMTVDPTTDTWSLEIAYEFVEMG